MGYLSKEDEELRGNVTRLVAKYGYAVEPELIATEVGLSIAEIEKGLIRLADAHALLLHPKEVKLWAVHPFALAPGSCWVKTARMGYWANCLYCAFGIAAALRADATIFTSMGGEEERVQYEIKDGVLTSTTGIFHLSTPVSKWWDNVIFACSSFQPFSNEEALADWCKRHHFPRGAVLSMEQLWGFAKDWYGDYLEKPWRKRSAEEVKAIFQSHGLVGSFWEIT